jgi:hypothetical protein
MIQRIQSLFLLFAILFLVLFMVLPYAMQVGNADVRSAAGQVNETIEVPGMIRSLSFLPLFLLEVVTGLLLIITLLRYRKRVVQMRFSLVGIFLLLGMQLMVFLLMWKRNGDSLDGIQFLLPIVFPLISCLWVYFAYRYIRKDEEMVRSADRIR